jgi:hypothetical protein
MQGVFGEQEMRDWARAYREHGTARFVGGRHFVIADMRGMKTTRPSVAEIMGAEIGYARQHGVVLCAHLSDDTVQRLQVSRIARQNAVGDDVTVDVVSMEEAYAVLREARVRIDEPASMASARLAQYDAQINRVMRGGAARARPEPR